MRYRLRAAVSRMAADCERMLEGLDRPERRLWRDAVGEALIASRHLLALIAHHDPGGEVADVAEYFVQLHGLIREPQRRIIDAMSSLLRLVPTGPEEELLMQDARTMRETAVELWALDDTVPSAAARGRRRRSAPPGAVAPDAAPATAPARRR